jgi:hypothetical protein
MWLFVIKCMMLLAALGFKRWERGVLHCIPRMPQLYMDNPQYKPLLGIIHV